MGNGRLVFLVVCLLLTGCARRFLEFVPTGAVQESPEGMPAPATMSNASARYLTLASVQIRWDPKDGATRYELARSFDNQSWQILAENALSPHVDRGLVNRPKARYRLRAYGGSGLLAESFLLALRTETGLTDERRDELLLANEAGEILSFRTEKNDGEWKLSQRILNRNAAFGQHVYPKRAPHMMLLAATLDARPRLLLFTNDGWTRLSTLSPEAALDWIGANFTAALGPRYDSGGVDTYLKGAFIDDTKEQILRVSAEGGVYVSRFSGDTYQWEEWYRNPNNPAYPRRSGSRWDVAYLRPGDSRAQLVLIAGAGVYAFESDGTRFVARTIDANVERGNNLYSVASRTTIEFEDIDGDGLDEMVAADRNGYLWLARLDAGQLVWSQGYSNSRFGPCFDASGSSCEMDFADYNGDGAQDILLADDKGNIYGLTFNRTKKAFEETLLYQDENATSHFMRHRANAQILPGYWDDSGNAGLLYAEGSTGNVVLFLSDGKRLTPVLAGSLPQHAPDFAGQSTLKPDRLLPDSLWPRPAAPKFKATVLNATDVRVEWESPNNEDLAEVRRIAGDGTVALLGAFGRTTRSVVDTGARPGTAVTYEVTLVRYGGANTSSAAARTTVGMPALPPPPQVRLGLAAADLFFVEWFGFVPGDGVRLYAEPAGTPEVLVGHLPVEAGNVVLGGNFGVTYQVRVVYEGFRGNRLYETSSPPLFITMPAF